MSPVPHLFCPQPCNAQTPAHMPFCTSFRCYIACAGRTQGPAGEAISEDPSALDRRAGDETSDYTLSNLGVVGPSGAHHALLWASVEGSHALPAALVSGLLSIHNGYVLKQSG